MSDEPAPTLLPDRYAEALRRSTAPERTPYSQTTNSSRRAARSRRCRKAGPACQRHADDEQHGADDVDEHELDAEQDQRRRPTETRRRSQSSGDDLVARRAEKSAEQQQKRCHEQHAAERRPCLRGDEQQQRSR